MRRTLQTVLAVLMILSFALVASPVVANDTPPLPGGTLSPEDIDKYIMPLIIPPAMPTTSKIKVKGGRNIDYYEIAVRQFEQ